MTKTSMSKVLMITPLGGFLYQDLMVSQQLFESLCGESNRDVKLRETNLLFDYRCTARVLVNVGNIARSAATS